MKLLARLANIFSKCFSPCQDDKGDDESATYMKWPSPDTDMFDEGEDYRAPGTIRHIEIDDGRGLVSKKEKVPQNSDVDQFQSLREYLKPPTRIAGRMGGVTIPFGNANGAKSVSSFAVPPVFVLSAGANNLYGRPVLDGVDQPTFKRWEEMKLRDAQVIWQDTLKSSRDIEKSPGRIAGRMGGVTIQFGNANGAKSISSFAVPPVFVLSAGANNLYDRPVLDGFDQPMFKKWEEMKLQDVIYRMRPVSASLNLAVSLKQLTSHGEMLH